MRSFAYMLAQENLAPVITFEVSSYEQGTV